MRPTNRGRMLPLLAAIGAIFAGAPGRRGHRPSPAIKTRREKLSRDKRRSGGWAFQAESPARRLKNRVRRGEVRFHGAPSAQRDATPLRPMSGRQLRKFRKVQQRAGLTLDGRAQVSR